MHLLVKIVIAMVAVFSAATQASDGKLRVNNELFDVGLTFGFLSVEDFPTEIISGIDISDKELGGVNATFRATEDFFIQYNYFQTTLGQSSIESNGGSENFNLGSGRKFVHYDLLLGYSLFQGEFFSAGSNTGAHLSALNVVAGVGESRIGDEDNFSYTLGFGYQIEFNRKYVMRFDYRKHTYKTSILEGSSSDTANATQMTVGLSWLF